MIIAFVVTYSIVENYQSALEPRVEERVSSLASVVVCSVLLTVLTYKANVAKFFLIVVCMRKSGENVVRFEA